MQENEHGVDYDFQVGNEVYIKKDGIICGPQNWAHLRLQMFLQMVQYVSNKGMSTNTSTSVILSPTLTKYCTILGASVTANFLANFD